MLSTQFVLLRPVRTLSPFPLSPFLSLSPVLSHSHSLLLQHLPPIISQTFAPRLPAVGMKWLWLQLQTLCMLKKDNNLQLVKLIVNFSVLMHLGWPYLCTATRNVNDIPPPLSPKPISCSHCIYTTCTFRNHLQSQWADYQDLYQGFWDQHL